jgi:hypothetical protein
MARTGPKAEVVEIKNVGHAPALMDEEQIGIIRDYVTAGDEDQPDGEVRAPLRL